MNHLLLIESKSRNGLAIIESLRREPDCVVSFLTSDLALYLEGRSPAATPLALAEQVVEVADSFDLVAMREAVARLHRERPLSAVFTLSEAHMPMAATLAEELGLLHPSSRAAAIARDKAQTRQILSRAGLPQPRFALTDTPEEAVTAANTLGFPVIVKPIDGYGSSLVSLAEDPAQALAAARNIVRFRDYGRGLRAAGRILVEEYMRGPVVSVEILSSRGRHQVLGLTSRHLSPPPAMIEVGGSFPARCDQEAEVRAMGCRSLDVIGFTDGAAHIEVCLSADGPKIIEINGRLIGYYLPELIRFATGIDPYVVLARVHLGELPAPVPVPNRVGSIYSLFSTRSGVIRAIHPSPLLQDPRVKLFHLARQPWDRVQGAQDNTGRIGFVMAVDTDEQASLALAKEVADTTELVVETDTQRQPLLLIDRVGYRRYCDSDGRPFIDPDRYDLSLITRTGLGGQAPAERRQHLIEMDIDDEALLERLAGALLDSRSYDRILAFSERFLEPAARLRRRFGIPGMQPEAAERVRDKVVMKQVLRQAGLRIPAFADPGDRPALDALLARHGRIVLKPRRGMGAAGVRIIADPEQLEAVLNHPDFQPAHYQGEEFIDGTMYHLDAVVQDGRIVFSAYFEYLTQCIAYADSAPLLDVSVTDPHLKARLEEFNRQVIAALDIRQGMTHHEVFVRPDGEIVFCEIANRAGGGAIGHGLRCLYGLDPYQTMVALELGQPLPPLKPHPDFDVAGLLILMPRPGRLVAVSTPEDFPEPWVLHRDIRRRVGEHLAAPRMSGDGLAFFVISGNSREQVVGRLHEVIGRFQCRVE